LERRGAGDLPRAMPMRVPFGSGVDPQACHFPRREVDAGGRFVRLERVERTRKADQ